METYEYCKDYSKYKIREVCQKYALKNNITAKDAYQLASKKMGISLSTFYRKSKSSFFDMGNGYSSENNGFANYQLRWFAEFLGIELVYLWTKEYRYFNIKRRNSLRKSLKEWEVVSDGN